MLLVADNLNPMNPKVADALDRLDPDAIQEIARRAEGAGARLLDLNPGYLSPSREDRMTFLVEAVQEVTSLPLILDSPHARILARGLEACRETPVLNAVSPEPQKLEQILPLAADHQTDLIVLLMDERSFTPPDLDGKISIAVQVREHALAAGLPHEKLIFDPVLPSLTWRDAVYQVGQVSQAVRLLAGGQIFGESARTAVGLSNLRSTQRHRIPVRIDEIYLSVLAGAGLNMVLADALGQEIPALCRILNQIN